VKSPAELAAKYIRCYLQQSNPIGGREEAELDLASLPPLTGDVELVREDEIAMPRSLLVSIRHLLADGVDLGRLVDRLLG
jgi:hypothetical protein